MIKIIKFFVFLIIILFSMLWAYENKDKIDSLKGKLKKFKKQSYSVEKSVEEIINVEANAFNIEVTKLFDLKDKTSFILNEINENQFNLNDVKFYLQNGYLVSKEKSEQLKLNNNYTLEFNGGLKSIFFYEGNTYGLVTSLSNSCYYASIVNLKKRAELFNTDCLPKIEEDDIIDFNGIGSSIVEEDEYFLISVGTPTTKAENIEKLAQNKNSYYGKILKINKSQLNENKITPEIFSIGHRNPQGLTKLNSEIFSVEHGPKGGDELNKIKKDHNYGWPQVSFGTKYLYDEDGSSYLKSHEDKGFEPPLFAFVPSVGISALNNCPSKLKNYYKKNCLIALSLNGNNLRPGNSLIIFLLDNKLEKVQSVEKIFIRSNYALRHFLTNKSNNIFEDNEGSIYLSIDAKGIYKMKFKDFR